MTKVCVLLDGNKKPIRIYDHAIDAGKELQRLDYSGSKGYQIVEFPVLLATDDAKAGLATYDWEMIAKMNYAQMTNDWSEFTKYVNQLPPLFEWLNQET